MFEKQLWKSDILSKYAGHWHFSQVSPITFKKLITWKQKRLSEVVTDDLK